MKRALIAAAVLLALAANAQAAPLQAFEARVVGVTDGDTITVRVANTPPYKIRLSGIDAPEKAQPYSDRSKKNLSSLVFDRIVHIEWSKPDKYGRIVGKVRVAAPGECAKAPCPATVDVNLAQVSAGYAWHYKHFENEQSKQDRLAYGIAEQHAREQKLGLWKDANPVPPWEWRHGAPKKPPGG
jgi:endonuclease YncB( thermonuclease family)